eukprot:8265473-Pyramimonas_sp.AAC.1
MAATAAICDDDNGGDAVSLMRGMRKYARAEIEYIWLASSLERAWAQGSPCCFPLPPGAMGRRLSACWKNARQGFIASRNDFRSCHLEE